MEAAERKKIARKEMGSIRASLDEDEIRRRSAPVSERLLSLPEYAASRSVMIYVSKKNEVYTHDLIRKAIADGKRVAAPLAIPATRSLELGPIGDFDTDLKPGRYGVLEPVSTGLDPSAIEVFVVPGVAFDRHGNRLGSGWGYFDKLLIHLSRRQLTVGLAFDFQVVDDLEKEDHDVAVDVILSEARTTRVCSERRKQ